MAETDSEPKTKEDVYRERNLLALAFLSALAERESHKNGRIEMGYWPGTDDVNNEKWAVVWCNLFTGTESGGEIHYGQVGWHVPLDMVPEWLEERDPRYDGYTTEEKNERIRKYVYN